MKNISNLWLDFFQTESNDANWWSRKIKLCNDRQAEIVRINGNGHLFHKIHYDNKVIYHYLLYLSFLMKQQHLFYKEEQVIPYQFSLADGKLLDHKELPREETEAPFSKSLHFSSRHKTSQSQRFSYDRRTAVNYAEHWWNSYNPKFETFTVDCTNYVSQCLLAGGAPMRGAPVRDQGWWYEEGDWSFSWAVAHSMRWYLSGSTQGLQGTEVHTANELYPGDVICYDFQGDGRWDHNTIVVAKDVNGMPLVNAHTDNSRHRYWSYEDSTAWTPNIKYKFFRIGESIS